MLTIKLTDVYGLLLTADAVLTLRKNNRLVLRTEVLGGVIDISGLSNGPSEVYLLQVQSKAYHTVSQFINIPAHQHTIVLVLPVKASKVRKADFPEYSALATSLQYLLYEAEYQALNDLQKACFFNILTKCQALGVLSNITDIQEIHQDRLYASVDAALPGLLASSETFTPAPDKLHKVPAGFSRAGSFKSTDTYGNLQITLFRKGNEYLADIDIDDAAGFRHIYQVVRNKVSGPTHPYNIHQILVGYQHLDPGYRLHV